MSKLNFKQILSSSSIVILSILIGFLLMESGVRLFIDKARWQFINPTDEWILDNEIGWVQAPHLNNKSMIYGKMINFSTNEVGVQVAGNPDAAIRILMLGDSTVVGRYVESGLRIHDFIVSQSRSPKDIFVINAGVQGYSTDQEYLLLKRLVKKYKPTIITLVICDNDFLQNQSHFGYGVPKPMYKDVNGFLVYQAPTKSISEIPKFGYGLQKIMQNSALYRMFQPSIVNLRALIGADSRLEKFNNGDTIYQQFQKYSQEIDWDLFLNLVLGIKRVASEENALFFLYKHPSVDEIWLDYRKKIGAGNEVFDFEDRIQSLFRGKNINYIEMNSEYLKKQDKGPFHLLPSDAHANAEGYKIQAELILRTIGK